MATLYGTALTPDRRQPTTDPASLSAPPSGTAAKESGPRSLGHEGLLGRPVSKSSAEVSESSAEVRICLSCLVLAGFSQNGSPLTACQRRTTLRQAPAWAVDNETASAGDSETAITRSACAARRRRLRSCAGHGPYRTCRIADDLLRLARRGIGTLQLRADGAASSKRASMRAAENERSKVKVEKSNPSAPSQAKSET